MMKMMNFKEFITENGLDGNLCFTKPGKGRRDEEGEEEEVVTYLTLRNAQNQAWAYHLVAEGVALAKKNDTEAAMKKYDLAIELDSRCIEAYVSRGCLYANQKKLRFATEDLEMALTLDSTHANAKLYLDRITQKERAKKERRKKAEKVIAAGEYVLPGNFQAL